MTATDRDRVEAVLRFWFGAPSDGTVDQARQGRWFSATDEFDRRCREGFEADLQRAAEGDLDHWTATPRGRLAMVILLDQFSRNIYRGTPRAFAQDPKALALCREELARGMDRLLHPVERAFFFMPLQHAEDRAAQRRSVECFEALLEDVSPAERPVFARFLDYARWHRDVVERFGRFPHRNAVLGRSSTAEERTFLARAGAPF